MAPYFVDALRNEYGEDQFYRYFANARDGKGVVLEYSFFNRVPDGTTHWYGDPNDGFQKYSSAEKAVVRRALAEFEAVANIRFRETTGNADIQFGQFDIDGQVAGYAGYPLYDKTNRELLRGPDRGDVWLDREFIDPHVVLHEVGHALGLEHPFEGVSQLPFEEDNSGNTVMSYTGNWGKTLQIYDVIALQSIYGPAERRLGRDTYKFGEDKLIWDGGGRDEITAANASRSVTIDLHDGSWNHVGQKAGAFLNDRHGIQVYLGNFTVIENLTGSSHNDRLSGNEIANRIAARQGDDRIEGGVGRDWLQGGVGSDEFIWTRLNESTVAKRGRDLIDDFHRSQDDSLDLKAIDADRHANGNQAFTFIGRHGFSDDPGELRVQGSGRNTLVSGDVTGDGKADFAFLLRGDIRLVEGDFAL